MAGAHPNLGGASSINSAAHLSLADEIFHSIRDRIIAWKICPGELLVEGNLAEQYEVSKTPVREALTLLRQDGLVNVIPRVGYLVTQVTIQDVHEIYDLRVILEGEAAAYVAHRDLEEELQKLLEEDRRKAMVLVEQGGSSGEYLRFHDTFHLGVARLSGNTRLARYITQLLMDGARVRMANPFMRNKEGIEEEQKDSEQIVRAMLEHDAKQARRLIQEHILKAKKRTLGLSLWAGSRLNMKSKYGL